MLAAEGMAMVGSLNQDCRESTTACNENGFNPQIFDKILRISTNY